ncbi:MaoC/PaaZ C-terminal domain-containing protein [Phytomonospora endophytica]|uniref:Acyl dehydratase n=1 Tax=Phytomonospora endophytica TaxID=714109 RepID=A0A841FI68_9ACTN|nr:MaoC/PaaZ C-terminal domain-containing protein [Phytomonospora endophytica]MBB6033272.1 acyl dehydratase [Phytomonospora endophytica]GIG65498.1 acyl dehydratase [Phytomonospora endophytica]
MPPLSGSEPLWFYEDLHPGRVFDLGVVEVTETDMLAFAERFDPQWYHLDPELSAKGPFGAVTASGWFTASVFMRAYVDNVLVHAAADASPGVEELRWPAPVYAGDHLAGQVEILDRRPSEARPGLGTLTLAGTLTNTATGRQVLRTRFRGWFAMREETPE